MRQGGTLLLSEADAKRTAMARALKLKPDMLSAAGPGYARVRLGRGAVVVYREDRAGRRRRSGEVAGPSAR